MTKPKFHFLLHLPFYIHHFGPALLFSTERYESFNTVFRLTCIHSNRQAPSRDCSTTFAHLDRVKHIISGGYWYDKRYGRFVCASKRVMGTVLKNSEYAHLIGLHKTRQKTPGEWDFYPSLCCKSPLIFQVRLLWPCLPRSNKPRASRN